MRYRVVSSQYGFKNRFWQKGTIVDIDEKENPPDNCFMPLSGKPRPQPITETEIKDKTPSRPRGRQKYYN